MQTEKVRSFLNKWVITCGSYKTKIKSGYKITYFDGDRDKTSIVTEEIIKLSDFTVSKFGSVLAGWKIDGKDGLYSNEYSVNVNDCSYVKAHFLDLVMVDGASIRTTPESSGLRFAATVSKTEFDNLITLLDGDYTLNCSVTGNMKTVTKKVSSNKLNYNQEKGVYFIYASIVDLDKNQYATDFRAIVEFSYVTKDGKEMTVKAVENENPERYIREVAQKVLDSDEQFTQEEIEIIRGYAQLNYASEIKNSITQSGHVQGVCVDDKYIYSSYGPSLIKQDIKTGKTVGVVENMRAKDEHGGDVAYYNGKIYIAYTLYGDLSFSKWSRESLSVPNCFIIEIEADKIVGNIDAKKTDIVRCIYIGKPIIDFVLSANGYDANGNELSDEYLAIGGLLGTVNAIDSVTFGPAPGKNDGKQYLTLGFSLPANAVRTDSNVAIYERVDNEYFPVMQFDTSKWTDDMYISFSELIALKGNSNKVLTQNMFKGPTTIDNVWYYRMGAHDYGIQNICYDAYQNVYLMGLYGYYGTKFTNFKGYVCDCSNATYQEIPYSGGLKGYVVKEKCGEAGKQNVYGYYWGEVEWGTGIASTGDGYYYVCSSGTNAQGNSTATNVLFRWNINKDNQFTATSPFEKIL